MKLNGVYFLLSGICLFFIQSIAYNVNFLSAQTNSYTNNKDIIHYEKGISYFLKRDFQKASEEFLHCLELNSKNSNAKLYMNIAGDKYFQSYLLFYKGVSYFLHRKYDLAIINLKKSLMINPRNKKAKFYLELCYVPKVLIDYNIILKREVFCKFYISVDTSMTIKDWIKEWELSIFKKKKKIKLYKGKNNPPSNIEWHIKRKYLNTNKEFFKYYFSIKSCYNRVVIFTNNIIIDTVKGKFYQERENIDRFLNKKKGDKIIKFLIPDTVLFDFNKWKLKNEAKKILFALIHFLNKNKEYKIKLAGYTDNIGDKDYNYKLSLKRAESVKNFLVRKGIEEKRIEFYGYGEENPVASNDTPAGREKNRRVEFKLVKN